MNLILIYSHPIHMDIIQSIDSTPNTISHIPSKIKAIKYNPDLHDDDESKCVDM